MVSFANTAEPALCIIGDVGKEMFPSDCTMVRVHKFAETWEASANQGPIMRACRMGPTITVSL